MKFTVTGTVTISVTTEVSDAESAEDALSKAAERRLTNLCYQCSRGDSRREWTVGDLDGEVSDLQAEARR